MEELTENIKNIQKAIKDCYWRHDITGVSICGSYLVAPCMQVIMKGNCETLIEYFKEKNKK